MSVAPVPYVAVPGTWAFSNRRDPAAWWRPGSPFALYLAAAGGLVPARPAPFLWSTDLEGIPWPPWRRRALDRNDWEAGGLALGWYLEHVAPADRVVIAHSHGAQVAAYAAAAGCRIDRLITVAAPVRRDLDEVWRAALPNIGAFLHVYVYGDRWQIFGALGDGAARWARSMPYAGIVNHGVPGVSKHSALLADPARFDLWRSQGWIGFARGDWREARP